MRSFFLARVSPTSYVFHYLNNSNYQMADLHRDSTTLESKLVTMLVRKEMLDIGYWRYPYPGHGKCLAPFRHGRRAIRERPIGEDIIPHDQRQ